MLRDGARLALLLFLCAQAWVACSPDRGGQAISPPFDDRKVLGNYTAVWTDTGDKRGFAAGDRLAEPQVRMRYRLDVHNRSGGKVFIRVGNFQLVDAQGLPLAADSSTVDCNLPDGTLAGVLGGDVWVPESSRRAVADFRVASLAVPLDDKGRDQFRRWQLLGRPDAAGDIDKEIARLASAPTCSGR